MLAIAAAPGLTPYPGGQSIKYLIGEAARLNEDNSAWCNLPAHTRGGL